MGDINLLPQQKKSAGGMKVSSSLRTALRFGILFLCLAVFVYAGIYLYFFVSTRLVSNTRTNLESQIQSLESTEQKMVLLRDRIEKTGKILATENADTSSSNLISLSTSMPEGVEIQDIKMNTDGFDISVKVDKSELISEFLKLLTSSSEYQKIEMVSMGFSSKDRYFLQVKAVTTKAAS